LNEEKPGTHLWMMKSLDFTSRLRRAWKSPPDEEKPGIHLWMKTSLDFNSRLKQLAE
jgi:hypothetical protein